MKKKRPLGDHYNDLCPFCGFKLKFEIVIFSDGSQGYDAECTNGICPYIRGSTTITDNERQYIK